MFETFEAHCGEGKVIRMDRAGFGRMKIGKCIKRDYGYMGCFIDILSGFDKR